MDFRKVGLSESEYNRIIGILGREPNALELELIGVMWSEHCSYKSTRPLLKTYPSKGKYVLQGQGENAGVVDMGEGCIQRLVVARRVLRRSARVDR